MSQTITWTTPKGNRYEYTPYAIGTKFNNVGGNYVYAYQKQNSWYATYIGQTNDLGARLSNHEKQACAVKNGATHILVRTNGSEASRLTEEAEMIALCKPVCNEQLK